MGGGGGEQKIDYAYNRRMAQVAERQQDIADYYTDFWKENNAPLEQQKIAANMQLLPKMTESEESSLDLQTAQNKAGLGLLPQQTEAQRSSYELQAAQNEAGLGLLPKQTELAGAQLDSRLGLLPKTTKAADKFLNQSLTGVNVADRMGQATASVAHQYKDAAASTARQMGRMGSNPSSARMLNTMGNMNMQRAKATAFGKETARRNAEDENYNRLSQATSFGLGLTS
ncbi:hypothetical protein [Maridesulfovibrio bastinii]|uniref:hypothetical protein n=1 Tax=Maridesulfovibrio bastinii TaxID=47157 RepID=UPI000425D50A|nr:hypothetical protein [Maridesulfovibrio bastinii]